MVKSAVGCHYGWVFLESLCVILTDFRSLPPVHLKFTRVAHRDPRNTLISIPVMATPYSVIAAIPIKNSGASLDGAP